MLNRWMWKCFFHSNYVLSTFLEWWVLDQQYFLSVRMLRTSDAQWRWKNHPCTTFLYIKIWHISRCTIQQKYHTIDDCEKEVYDKTSSPNPGMVKFNWYSTTVILMFYWFPMTLNKNICMHNFRSWVNLFTTKMGNKYQKSVVKAHILNHTFLLMASFKTQVLDIKRNTFLYAYLYMYKHTM